MADPARGTLTGNRGILVAPDGRMTARQWAGKAWITCLLNFRDRKRPVAQAHTWTELFFLDEAVALAAGHRPCAFCRRGAYTDYREKFPGARRAVEMDAILHTERLAGRSKRRHSVRIEDLPDGAFIDHGSAAHLVWGASLLPHGPMGYAPAIPRPRGPTLSLTPPATLAVLSKRYRPMLHTTAPPLTHP